MHLFLNYGGAHSVLGERSFALDLIAMDVTAGRTTKEEHIMLMGRHRAFPHHKAIGLTKRANKEMRATPRGSYSIKETKQTTSTETSQNKSLVNKRTQLDVTTPRNSGILETGQDGWKIPGTSLPNVNADRSR